ncbi:hypothetical protein PENSPDRAFT_683987 [Peniophora sp. CONT]|nr:hypothetical protein PENSPDRAFT_683987 [Peniophora sp. CONT]
MPAPMVYVAVSVCTVAAALAFKEFVYDPHLRPKLQEFWEEQRQRRRRRHQPMAQRGRRDDSSSGSSNDLGDDNVPLGFHHAVPLGSLHGGIELETLVAQEVDAWRNGVEVRPDTSGLRQRTARGMESSSTFLPPAHIMDQHDTAGFSTPPMQPTRASDVLFDSADSPEFRAETPTLASMSSRTLSPEAPISRSSTPNSDLLSPSMLTAADAAYFTSGSPSTLSGSPVRSPPTIAGVLSPRDGAMSPFSDLMSPPSEFAELSDARLSDSDEEMFSVPSHAPTDLEDEDGHSSDEFERISEASSWAHAESH